MASSLGPLEIQLLAYVQGRNLQTVEAGKLRDALGWTAPQERRVLSRLAGKRLIARVRPGLYLVPPRLPPGNQWTPGEFQALSMLIADRDGRYQVSGPNAFYRYGWSEQIPNRIYAYNNRISGDREIGSVALTLIKVDDARLGHTVIVRTGDGAEAVYASKARALVDAVYDWSRFGTLPQAFDWIGREVKMVPGFAAELIESTIAFGNQGTIRRIGAVLEHLQVQEPLLRRLEREVHPSTSFIAWVPNREKRGAMAKKTSKRWGVVLNEER